MFILGKGEGKGRTSCSREKKANPMATQSSRTKKENKAPGKSSDGGDALEGRERTLSRT